MSFPRALFFLSALAASSFATPHRRDNLLSCLAGIGVTTLSPGEDGYDNAAAAYNQRYDYQPAAIIYPVDDSSASAAVTCAASAAYPVVARSGGHSYAAFGLGGADGSVVIDLSQFTEISILDDGVTATIGTGNRLGDVVLGLYNQGGRALPHGTCPYVGIGGHAGFGGYGFQSRLWGLTLDRMVGAHGVLPNGTVVDVSENQYPDIFWAIRGSAPSFLIALSYTFSTLAAPETTTYFTYDFSGNASLAAFSLFTFQSFGQDVDGALSAEWVIGNGLTWTIVGAYTGTSDEFAPVIQPLLSQLPPPDSNSIEELDWIGYQTAVSSGNGNLNTSTGPDSRDTFYAKSAVVPASTPLSTDNVAAFINWLFDKGSSSTTNWFIEAELYGGTQSAISTVPENATAYSNRDGLLTFQLYASSSNYSPPYPKKGFRFVDGMFNALSSGRSVALGEYPNYVDDKLTDAQWHTGYYGSNYVRLLSIKDVVDPDGVFSYPQAIGK